MRKGTVVPSMSQITAAIKLIPWRETHVIQTRTMTGGKRLLWSFWPRNARS